jgi:mannosyltransferase OCH1-like enzyme
VKIPRIIHQTWKNEKIPGKWKPFQQKVKQLHPDWEYRLWTDSDNLDFVRKYYTGFFGIFSRYPKNIMRADVIRYLIMDKIGGLYLDLDYEMIKPFNFQNDTIILPLNRSKKFGDNYDSLGNCIFASIPGHQFWKDVINHLKQNQDDVIEYIQVLDATGPGLLTKIFYQNQYDDIYTPERMVFHPPVPANKKEYLEILNNGISYGIHHGWGIWKERFTWSHLKIKLSELSAHLQSNNFN